MRIVILIHSVRYRPNCCCHIIVVGFSTTANTSFWRFEIKASS